MVRKHKKVSNCSKFNFAGLSLSWAESVSIADVNQDHCLSAYDINFPKHGSSCKKNCSSNPFCLGGLIREETGSNGALEEEDILNSVRDSNAVVGLRNLGATCYMNSLLQLLFSNILFRNIILSLDVSGVIKSCGDSALEFPNPAAVICNLQYLFAAMLYGNKSVADPSGFVNSLNLEPSTQQDAHEFLQLLLNIFDVYLTRENDPSTRDFIRKTFQGEYTYVTTCSVCQKPSARSSTFYELDLKMSSSLYDSLQEFFKEEDLQGSDRYRCSVCSELREATRRIVLNALPPVLILQIMRFFYDRNTGVKKKLRTTIKFPEKLDMKPFIKSSTRDYRLAGMLIHEGPSAYSGHYIAHVFEESRGDWIIFNDEVSERIGPKQMQKMYRLSARKKDESLEKGMLYSNNVYMLMYIDKASHDNVTIPKENLHPYILERLDQLNENMNERVKAAQSILAEGQNNSESRKNVLLKMFSSMPATSEYDVISLKWLSHWILTSLKGGPVKPIENKPILCVHGKLSLKFSAYKYISSHVASILYEEYGGGPRLTAPLVFCLECIKVRVLDIKFRSKVNQLHKEYVLSQKSHETLNEETFLIGKKSLKLWKRLVLAMNPYSLDNPENGDACDEIHEDPKPDVSLKEENCDVLENNKKAEKSAINDARDEKTVHYDCKTLDSLDNSNNSPVEPDFVFNDDILCKHGSLLPGAENKRCVDYKTWIALSSYFQEAPQFKGDAEPCTNCLEDVKKVDMEMERNRVQSKLERAALPDLATGKRLKCFKNGKYFLLHNEQFVDPWKVFLRDWRQGAPRPTSLSMSALLCPHDFLMYDPADKEDLERITVVNEETWASLDLFYCLPYDPSRPVIVEYTQGQVSSTSPAICKECTLSRREALRQLPVSFSSAIIFIRPIGSSSEIDPSYLANNKEETSSSLRRSSRKRASPGDISLTVRDNDTLSVLRSKIYDKLHVLPYAQKLILQDGTVLTDDLPLKDLHIKPYSVIYLQSMDEDDGSELDYFLFDDTQKEVGFKSFNV